MSATWAEARWAAAAELLADCGAVLSARPVDDAVPGALAARGWDGFLLALDDDALGALEAGGLDAPWDALAAAPPSLVAMLARARAVCTLEPLAEFTPAATERGPRPPRRHETPRKQAQVEALARLVLPLARASTRVVDVGSGHGHLTRALAEALAMPVVGLELRDALVAKARGLAAGGAGGGGAAFAVRDVLRDGLDLADGDCVVGLHACGELGDVMVESVAARGRALVLVGCCLQKRRALSRRPLWRPAPSPGARGSDGDAALDLPRELLGLSNLTAGDEGVEASCTANLEARARRVAVHRLLTLAGVPVRFGAELEGLNRRASHGELGALVARIFALRGLCPPSAAAVDDAAAWARQQHGRARRLSIPRVLLARVLEVFVLVDRARALEARGFTVRAGPLFPARVSGRNLALAAVREPARRSARPPA